MNCWNIGCIFNNYWNSGFTFNNCCSNVCRSKDVDGHGPLWKKKINKQKKETKHKNSKTREK